MAFCGTKFLEPIPLYPSSSSSSSSVHPTTESKRCATRVTCRIVRSKTPAKLAVRAPVAIIEGNVSYPKLLVADEAKREKSWKIKSGVDKIKNILGKIEDGDITISPYDTAWIATIPSSKVGSEPEFPSSLKWIINNQLPDGSWGETRVFSVRDRILNTLACLIALRTWNSFFHGIHRGLEFVRKYIPKMNEEDESRTLIGFEIVFPALIEDAKAMGLELPYDDHILHKLYTERALKLERIPPEILHEIPSTLLHSLEGLRNQVKWDKLSKLQSPNGSYLFSPASTACAFSRNGDLNSLRYLQDIVNKFGGGAPNVYPVDLFERLWSVDRIQRLGISRHFYTEIQESLEYVYRHWTNRGIGWARDSPVKDVDDTSMAFRLLRLHGFHVDPGAFNHFKDKDQFFCFFGQTNQAITGIFNLYRASQLSFPGETILEEAMDFSTTYLRRKTTENKLKDKWVIAQDLTGEVGYALKYPWICSQPRIETRMYIDQYGADDVWIGKTLYRMPSVSNKAYIELAKEDFAFCQSIHRNELTRYIEWYKESGFETMGITKTDVIKFYFLSAIAIFEPEMARARLAWCQCLMLIRGIRMVFCNLSFHQKRRFAKTFPRRNGRLQLEGLPQEAYTAMKCLTQSVEIISAQNSHNCCQILNYSWERWLAGEAESNEDERFWKKGEAEVIVVTAVIASADKKEQEKISGGHFKKLLDMTNLVCCDIQVQTRTQRSAERVDNEMRSVIRECLQNHTSLTARLCLAVTKSFYYAAHCTNEEMARHIDMVLFEPVR